MPTITGDTSKTMWWATGWIFSTLTTSSKHLSKLWVRPLRSLSQVVICLLAVLSTSRKEQDSRCRDTKLASRISIAWRYRKAWFALTTTPLWTGKIRTYSSSWRTRAMTHRLVAYISLVNLEETSPWASQMWLWATTMKLTLKKSTQSMEPLLPTGTRLQSKDRALALTAISTTLLFTARKKWAAWIFLKKQTW